MTSRPVAVDWMPSCRNSDTLTRRSCRKRSSVWRSRCCCPKLSPPYVLCTSASTPCTSATHAAESGSGASIARIWARCRLVTATMPSILVEHSSWYFHPMIIRSNSLSMLDSLRRMMEECARRSKIFLTEGTEYSSWGVNSLSTYWRSNMVLATSFSTLPLLSGGMFWALSLCSRMNIISQPKFTTIMGIANNDISGKLND
mmetsp:Transcript_38121/g.96399  ORF Transcript_38121/g.96399 Transcript_38121/m.96399 type:complete len:201 (-) Transcript_38121:84-686(-)